MDTSRGAETNGARCYGRNRDPDPSALGQLALRSWALALKKRLGFKRAAVALARKLAVALHVMWKTGKNFDPNHRLKRKRMPTTSAISSMARSGMKKNADVWLVKRDG